jgi:isopentenyl-diphosphate delta-isomerase
MSGPDGGVEQVVLLDESGHAVGVADKATVHHRDTPLHLAFSCYVRDAGGAVLVTRRAASKPTWPGEWTNSVCGHPAPGESLPDAVRRRAEQELGLRLDDVRLVLATFRYRAVMPDGVVENEMCPVFTATTTGTARPDPDEVDGWAWVDWSDFRTSVLDGTRAVSPWCLEQVAQLPPDPWAPGTEPSGELPPGADPR